MNGERYKYVKSANGLKLGATSSCSGKEVQVKCQVLYELFESKFNIFRDFRNS